MLDICMFLFRWGARDEANVVRASGTLLSNVTQFFCHILRLFI